MTNKYLISPRIQKILDTDYKFRGKHAEFMKNFTYKQESKYGVTPYEDHLLRAKFDQMPDGSFWVKSGLDQEGNSQYTERNVEMELFG